jgi:hypothetical protein
MTAGARIERINTDQNAADKLDLLFAAHVEHRRAIWVDNCRTWLTLLFVPAAVIAAFVDSLAAPLAIAGAGTTIIIEIVDRLLGDRFTSKAMLLQERFDTELFELPWNDQLGPVPLDEDVHHLAAKYKGTPDEKRDWYVNVSDLPLVYAIPICQRQNLAWDFQLRRTWGWAIGMVTIAWVVIGVVVALIADWSTRDLFIRWLVPSMPALVFGFEEARAHLSTASSKEQLARSTRRSLDDLQPGEPDSALEAELSTAARERQDEIARLRQEDTRVPQWFYKWRRPEDQMAADKAAANLRTRLIARSNPVEPST